MTKSLELLFDFASPNVYFAWRALPPLLQRTGADLVVTPCLLGGLFKLTGNRAPFEAYAGVKGKIDYERLEIRRFIQDHGIAKFRMNPHFPVNTLNLMRGLVAAEAEGVKAAYIEAGLAGVWEEGLPMSDPAVLAGRLQAAGLDAERLAALAQTAEIKQRLVDLTQSAADRGAFGLPTFFIGSEMFFGKERLGQVERELAGASG
jgi:2-hydroxychromene-2-carboxylate isomerase